MNRRMSALETTTNSERRPQLMLHAPLPATHRGQQAFLWPERLILCGTQQSSHLSQQGVKSRPPADIGVNIS
jgi:hypothetical protein